MTESMYYLNRVIASWFQAFGVIIATTVFIFSVRVYEKAYHLFDKEFVKWVNK